MARVKGQDIPPELVHPYQDTLGPTRPFRFPGGTPPEDDHVCCKHYPYTIEPPHVPSAKQLYRRAQFCKSVLWFSHTPDNERHAYYRLSGDEGLFYYNYYHHIAIPLIGSGITEKDFMRPLASAYLDEDQIPWGYLAGRFSANFSTMATAEIWTDPIQYEHHYNRVNSALVLAHEYWIYWVDPPFWSIEDWYNIPLGPGRQKIIAQLACIYYGLTERRVVLYRSGAGVDQTVCWSLQVTLCELEYDFENFYEFTH
jgi:hypothetical protein